MKPDMNSHNTIGDVAIPAMVIIFSVFVFIQQQFATISVEAVLVKGQNLETSAHDT